MQCACSAVYRRLWLVRLYIFPHCLISSTIFGKNLLNIKFMFRFSVQLLPEIFLILRRIERGIIKMKLFFMYSTRYSSDFDETGIFLTGFRTILKYNIS